MDGPAPNSLGVDLRRCDAQCGEAGSQVAHECRRPADVKITIARQVKFLERLHVEAPGSVEIDIGTILGVGRAIANVAMVVGKRLKQSTRLFGKGMFAAVTRSVQPPDFPRRCFGCQRMKHREHRRHADPGA